MVRTRIAPSPTGEDIHIGNLYTALINWVWAKKNKGKFIIRIEDTDQERLVKGSQQKILETINAFGLHYDEAPDRDGPYKPYRQSERLPIYKKHVEELIRKGAAYYCNCSKERLAQIRRIALKQKQIPKYDKHCLSRQEEVKEEIKKGKPFVIRLNVPENKEIKFRDVIRGEVKIMSDNLDDQVLMKSDGFPTYHLAVVVDDYLMKISHVIRAEEWLSSTPKHILLYEAFGWPLPIFAHVPILRNPDHSKLSKRKNPVWASWYLEQGYLPEAVLNYLALMGWSHPEQKEIFLMSEFVEVFDLKDIKAVGPAFDRVKLEWMNGEYLRKLPISNFQFLITNFYKNKLPKDIVIKTIPLIRERIKKLSDYLPLCEFFFKKPDRYDIDLSSKKELLVKVRKELERVKEWKADTIGQTMQDMANREKVKTGEFFMTLRIAITGKKISPPLNESMEILGKEECLARLDIF
ncbi:glutamate--tRNA ligase [Candidatus Roizmanbacteria bacterium RIFCSPHIGHO2_01_FULL_39_8]|uniref:Glutamate--tRNA ligase n=3 Tax=Candidatus Roizmaniibacteriota TaxID=1752723 RepID=A0A1F7GJ06_9BACT|nr:MAG: glutamate--tRNA ligase [Candidatus Roizmanbacteria bacterium RIFCSPHIGHO2_01_FULL_39_8]OGK25642.1 MAG: glutamate--tRNA ligase [Candidatus Roizmanbacteria bacterium RIFCSPHIGHO2_02_FULL_39_9]OGK35274.1 MAG: glutamate--tRNA ligase [Candidatus Roizmanbacteria bacterium RIFCSPHIGHO2_12_FULL_39_8]